MSAHTSTQDTSHIHENFAFFQKKLNAGELDEYMGDFVLIVDKKIVSVHPTSRDAYMTGLTMEEKSTSLKFSIQEVTHEIIDLGFYSAFA